MTLEARREASRELLTPHTEAIEAEDQARRMGATEVERREIEPRYDGEAARTQRRATP